MRSGLAYNIYAGPLSLSRPSQLKSRTAAPLSLIILYGREVRQVFEWNMSVQKMLDCVEENLTGPLTLEMLAGRLNYSPFYCTRQFHKSAGISLRNYIRLRKVSSAVIDLRDTGDRILDIAVKYGFSSQEAFN